MYCHFGFGMLILWPGPLGTQKGPVWDPFWDHFGIQFGDYFGVRFRRRLGIPVSAKTIVKQSLLTLSALPFGSPFGPPFAPPPRSGGLAGCGLRTTF